MRTCAGGRSGILPSGFGIHQGFFCARSSLDASPAAPDRSFKDGPG